jgi:hypothetical protein
VQIGCDSLLLNETAWTVLRRDLTLWETAAGEPGDRVNHAPVTRKIALAGGWAGNCHPEPFLNPRAK